MNTIDLNADLGEGEGADIELMALISSCNIACGGHTGDTDSMRAALVLARQHNVAVGAHPSYPDREGFGRRSLFIEGKALFDALVEQTKQLLAVASQEQLTVSHLKPHGALYNDACAEPELALIVAQVAAKFDLKLVGLPDSMLAAAAQETGCVYIAEGFVDRSYESNGRLRSRLLDGAVHHSQDNVVEQALALASGQPVVTADGDTIKLEVDTLCIHSDTPSAVDLATAVRQALLSAGIEIRDVQN